jgi:hypothetical protein
VKPGRVALRAPVGGDRLHLFVGGQPAGVLGVGPGASDEVAVTLKKGAPALVVLAENLGRASAGARLVEPKGLPGHLFVSDEVRAGKPKLVRSQPLEPLKFRTPLWDLSPGDATHPDRVTWSVPGGKKSSVAMTVAGLPCRALLVINDKPVEFLEPSGPRVVVLDAEALSKATNSVQVALLVDGPVLPEGSGVQDPEVDGALRALGEGVRFHRLSDALTEDADWAFAKWEAPAPTAFAPAKSLPRGRSGLPSWWRTTFTLRDAGTPVYLELPGMTKGQVYLNGRHVGRYFVADGEGASVPPQTRWHLPAPWLHAGPEGAPNELMLFDEHGASPAQVRVVYDASARPITARGTGVVVDAPPPPPPPPPAPTKPAKGSKSGKGAKAAKK